MVRSQASDRENRTACHWESSSLSPPINTRPDQTAEDSYWLQTYENIFVETDWILSPIATVKGELKMIILEVSMNQRNGYSKQKLLSKSCKPAF